ncbi:ADP-ribose pyrophosphatase [Vallitalea longa]|uniref:ADP-ribose pyrophosphatase n=1 Tax=Vallitalea longa TaxID=2936439 RepID=A0A9W5YCI4_9FIRM|nr:NUDIX hydrolase [Vallitalea longa]GKX30056.1 ADP-ribose pyrophosphatase [Vallitalea longa]
MNNKWLQWAKQLQSIAQSGLAFSKNEFDIERFEKIRNISIEIMSEYTELSNDKIRTLFANESGYQTPKIDVRAAIFKNGKILLVNEKKDKRWSMPGGYADIDLSISENAKKESMEEAGANVDPKRIIAVLDRNKYIKDDYPYAIYKIFVECDYIDGRYTDNLETSNAKFFEYENLPELSVGRNTKDQIKMCFEARETDILEPIFD